MKRKKSINTINVSYILATKNRAKFLKVVLKNIREYITKNDELIIVDGGSIDETKKLVKRNKDIVSKFISEPDDGEAHAFNKGLLYARGKYIKPITDDDYFYPKTMHLAVKRLMQNPEIEALICGGEAFLASNLADKGKFQIFLKLPPGVQNMRDLDNFESSVLCGLGLFIRRDAVAKIGLYDVNFRSIDLDYVSRILRSKLCLKYLNVKLYRHVTYPHSNQRNISQSVIDLGRIYLRHGKWEKLLRMESAVLDRVFSFDNSIVVKFFKMSIDIWKHVEMAKRKEIWLFCKTGMKTQSTKSDSYKTTESWDGKLY